MNLPRTFLLSVALLGALGAPLFGKREKWPLPDGKTITGEPTEIVGPFAVIDTGDVGKRLLLSKFSDSDLARLNAALDKRGHRATEWKNAEGGIAKALATVGMKVDAGKLKKPAIKGPEPLLYVVFLASSGVGPSWEFTGKGSEPYYRFQKEFPGQVEFVMLGINHSAADQENMMASMNVPFWSVSPRDADPEDSLTRLRSTTIPLAILTTRDGTPLNVVNEVAQIPALLSDLEGMLRMERGIDPRAWADRQSYVARTNKMKFAKGECPPVLVGDPFDPEALKKFGIESFDASLSIRPDGSVKSVMLKTGGKFPEKMSKDLTAALQQALYAPAVKDGAFVASDTEYHFSSVSK